MPNTRYKIYNRAFSEYVYRILKNLTSDQKKNLTDEDLKILRSTSTISRFCKDEQLDRMLLLLTKIGKIWTLRVADENTDADQLEFAIINQFYSDEKRSDIIKVMAEDNIFYMSATETMLSLMMAAQNINTPYYQLSTNSRDLVQKNSDIKSIKMPLDEKVQKSIDGYEMLDNLLLQQLNSLVWAKKALDLEQTEIRILCFLFLKRNGATNMQTIAENTQLNDNKAYLKKYVQNLTQKKLIVSDSRRGGQAKPTTFYFITPEGVRQIMKYNDYIYKQAFKK